MTIEIVCHKMIVITRVAGIIQSSSWQNSSGRQLVFKPLCAVWEICIIQSDAYTHILGGDMSYTGIGMISCLVLDNVCIYCIITFYCLLPSFLQIHNSDLC